MRKTPFIGAIFALTLFSGLAGATTVISTFDIDLDGWFTNPQGTLAWAPTGGNPDGYLEETDASSNGNMHVSAPAKFLGDLTGATTLSADIRAYATPGSVQGAFGVLTFLNGASSISLDLGDPSTLWTTYATPLTPVAFGVDAATYAAVMSNVTSITLILEADKNADTEKVGLDNFAISGELGGGVGASTPEPASIGLVGAALAIVGLARRKRTKSQE